MYKILQTAYRKSMSSTLMELISTTKMLKFTTTGAPFSDGGLISATIVYYVLFG